jgi:probable HAF family extracellular repeat protein
MRPLPTLGGTHGYAAGANNHGQIVGWAESQMRDDSCTHPQIFQFRAVVWGPEGNRIHELPLLGDESSSAATAINDRGQIVGISGACDDAIGSATAENMVLWEGGMATELPNFGGKEWNTPTAINQRGDIVGFANHVGDVVTEAFIWTTDGGLHGLGFLDDHGFSQAFGINERRQVVGLSCTLQQTDCRAFLWQNGVMADLNLLVPREDGELLLQAMDINDDGVITGRATTADGLSAYVATPLGEGVSSRALASRRWTGDKHVPRRHLSDDVVREIVWPFGPGRERSAPAR